MTRDQIDDGFLLHERYGTVAFRNLPNDVVLHTYEGGITEATVPDMQAALADIFEQRDKISLFVDAERLETYTTEYRKRWATWLKEHRSRLHGCHILVRSALVRMGVNLVNPLIGGYMVPYSNRERFIQALRDVSDAAPECTGS